MTTPVRRLAMLATALMASVGAAVVGYAVPAQAEPAALIVIEPDHLEGRHTVPLQLEDFAPGDSRTASVLVRNDTDRAARIAYTHAVFGDDSMSEYVWITIRHDGVEMVHGRAGSVRVDGARFEIAPGSTSTLEVELAMHRGEGNAAQGSSMRVRLEFAVKGGAAPLATGVAADGTPLTAGGSDTQTLPPTGESLSTFHLLVWSTLAAFAAALLALLLTAVQRRGEQRR